MNWKKIATVALAGLMTTALLAGCGDDKPGAPTAPGKTAEAPAPPERHVEGVEFDYGGHHKGKVYAIKAPKSGGIELANDPVFMQDAIYIHGDEEKDGADKDYLLRLSLQGEKLSAPEVITESKGYGAIAANGKAVFCNSNKPEDKGKAVSYDGKNLTQLDGKWPDKAVGIAGSDEFLICAGMDAIKIGTVTGNKLEMKDVATLADNRGYEPIYADQNELYIAAAGPDEERALLVLDKSGKEVRTITGWRDDEFGFWAVTQNYIVMFGDAEYNEKADDDVCPLRVFDRATGKEIGEATVANFSPESAVQMSGNTLIAHGDDETFYIIDL
ncbi:MAG: hypothetical protein IJ849_11870 [Selenomonadaceae bacterium]|nr:hypothetical protein [Selenomonadaceae bacterium]